MKKFQCGHAGRGQFCHRCDQAAALTAKVKKETDAEKITKMKAEIERLYAVPKKTSDVPMMPSDPVPA